MMWGLDSGVKFSSRGGRPESRGSGESSWIPKPWRVIVSREALAGHPESRSSGESSWVAKRRKDRCPSKAVQQARRKSDRSSLCRPWM